MTFDLCLFECNLEWVYLLFSCQLDSSDRALEAKLTDAFEAQIVPEEHFVCGKLWPLTASNKGENVRSEHHLHDADSSVQFYMKKLNISCLSCAEHDASLFGPQVTYFSCASP